MRGDSELSVLWISKVHHRSGMYNLRHRHSYFHFGCTMPKSDTSETKQGSLTRPLCCFAPETMHSGETFRTDVHSINVMFFVNNKALYKMIERFPFDQVKKEYAHLEMLEDIVELCHAQADPELINVIFNGYLRRIMHENKDLLNGQKTMTIPEKCAEYIDMHYMEPLTLDDVANYVGKSRYYTSTLFNESMGMNMTEYLNSVRMKHACSLMAYSALPMGEIAEKCGFSDVKYFGKVFKNVVGISPARYRTSHVVRDCRFEGSAEFLKEPYQENEDTFTYVVDAQKLVKWRSPYEYILQQPEGEECV